LQIPTSTLLARLVADAPPDRISIAWFAARLEDRSFGLLVLVMAIIGLTPGIASFSGFLLAIPSIQMIIGRASPALPAFLAKRSISTPHFGKWVARVIPPLRYAEALVHPRWQMPPAVVKRVVGAANLVMAATITLPFPFAYTIPTAVIILISFAYLEEDGLLLSVGCFAAFVSFAFSAAQVWAALKAASFIVHF
jgi:hypothetical protein